MHFLVFFADLFILKNLGYLYLAMNLSLIIALPFDSPHRTLAQKLESGCCREAAIFPGAESFRSTK